jgi:pYEATS domain-containing protein involved in immunity/TIR domain-containing protein
MTAPQPEELLEDTPPRAGRIITFYSYKGGTGRSMALANVAWILASNGRRVLAIDWDLEAPGLHRYFRPFLADDEMVETPGLIDFFVHFVEAACIQASSRAPSPSDRSWFEGRADLARYAVPLDYEFLAGGTLDFVSAGQQGPSYAGRVNSFQWGNFYEKLGGGIFLEAMKARLREQYDYVLIDSRTGLSDTSGICTVQMPDELVICFTLNRQSIFGAAATAASADAQRRLRTGEQGLRIWPVACRVELAEQERLEAARQVAREKFAPFLWHIPAAHRPDYWGSVEMLYFPYYAYEEVLATIADTGRQTTSLLGCIARLTARLTEREEIPVTSMPLIMPADRAALLARYQPARPAAAANAESQTPPRRFFLSYAKLDGSAEVVRQIGAALDQQFGKGAAFWDEKVPLGARWDEVLESKIREADTLIAVIGRLWRGSHSHGETSNAIKTGKIVVPIVLYDGIWSDLPLEVGELRGMLFHQDSPDSLGADLQALIAALAENAPAVDFAATAATPVDVDDPQRGQWGGKSEHSGWRLTAEVREAGNGWFDVTLIVESTRNWSFDDNVEFHLHPSFIPAKVVVPVQDGRAVLRQRAWGAYTVGVAADGGQTRLELNLAELPDAPELFRAR